MMSILASINRTSSSTLLSSDLAAASSRQWTKTMPASRFVVRCLRPSAAFHSSRLTTTAFTQFRAFGTSVVRAKDLNDRAPSTAPEHREYQKSRPVNPRVTGSTSTRTNDYPKVGEKNAPPELPTSVDPDYKPAQPYAGKVEHFTGNFQSSAPQKPELDVGEMEGITFKVEPLRRHGEDPSTMRARLLCTSSPCGDGYANTAELFQTRVGREAFSRQTYCSPPSLMHIWLI